MTGAQPHEIPFRSHYRPLGSFGRVLAALALILGFALVAYRWSFEHIPPEVHRNRGHPDPELLQERIAEFASQLYADDFVLVDFAELILNVGLSVYVAVPVLACTIVTIGILIRRRW